jgi:hypothetical protein
VERILISPLGGVCVQTEEDIIWRYGSLQEDRVNIPSMNKRVHKDE